MSQKTIEATPRKSFFTEMLTRDITLEDCILDLIDNSIHWIISASELDVTEIFNSNNTTQKDVFNWYHVKVNFDKDSFTIEDNWSWISSEYLEKYVFRFWSDWEDVSSRKIKWLSVYWVWMKRSFFKIGRYAHLSTLTTNEISDLKWDIEEWLKKDWNEEWNLSFDVEDNTERKPIWTFIKIQKLNKEISDIFQLDTFKSSLIKKIALTYSLFLECWLKIDVWEYSWIKANLPKIISSKDLDYWSHSEDYINDKWNLIGNFRLIVWLTDEEKADYYWWNVFCNWRMILQWDKTMKTWWWVALRQYHSSLNPFIGYIFFTSNNAADLPWNTTKDNITLENNFYQYALSSMVKYTKPVTNYLASRYKTTDTIWEFEEEEKKMQQQETKTIWEILQKKSDKSFHFKHPSIKSKTIEKKFEKITYQIEIDRLNKVKDVMMDLYSIDEEDIDTSIIWKNTFDYFFNKEC